MSKLLCLTHTIWLLLFSASTHAAWFSGSDALTSAHQRLLEGNTSESFDAMVEVWQQHNNKDQHGQFSKLLSLAITEDCGRSLSNLSLPSWLQNVVIRRETVQTTSRIQYRFSISGDSSDGVASVSLSRWPEDEVLSGSVGVDEANHFKLELEGMSTPVSSGLYQLAIESQEGESWASWLIMTRPEPLQKISWKDSRSWRISPPSDLNSVCQRPFITMNLFSQADIESGPIWAEEKHKQLPVALPVLDVPDGQYWLSVALVEKRWQGAISIEEVQRIGRSIELPDIDIKSFAALEQH